MFPIWQDGEPVLSASVDDVADGIFRGSVADRRELLSLLRARICLSCAQPRTGMFAACPMCQKPYPEDP